MSFDTQSFYIDSFDGGITDNYLDGVPNRYRYAENFIVTSNKKLFTRPGSLIFDSTYYQIPAGAQRIGALISFNNTALFIQSAKKFYYISSGWQTLTGPSGNDVLTSGSTSSFVSSAFWNGHLFVTSDAYPPVQKIYADGAGAWKVRNAGLPGLATNPTVTAGASGGNNYLYAFHYYYAYSVGTVSFADQGEVTTLELTSSAAPNTTPVAITNIPVIANGVTDNYDTANIKVQIYRTINNGTVLYYVGEVTNGTTTYNDNKSDASIQDTGIEIYTTDGTLDYELPPKCKFVHLTNNVLYYASIKDGSQELKNIVQQGVPNNPDATNSFFQVAVDEDIVGISSFEYTPIVFCANSIFRLDGTFAKDGTGGISKQKISDTVGCVSNNSIVRTSKGTFFAGTDGFYWTDGLQVMKISTEFDKRYKEFISNVPSKIVGTYDTVEDRVLWSVPVNTIENDTIFCLHLKFGIRPDACFTTWTGSTNFVPTSLLYYQRQLLRADSRGYVFKHDDSTFTDPKIDTTKAASLWAKKSIIYNYEGCAFNFGMSQYRKWVTRTLITASNETKLSMAIQSINDAGRKKDFLRPIDFNDSVVWGEEDIIWGDPNVIWGFDGLIEEQRRFPAGGLRCSYKQLIFTNDYTLIDSSTVSGAATTNSAAKTVVLNNGSSTWPVTGEDYFIAFSGDNYTRHFLITSLTTTTLTVSDAANRLPSGSYDWKIYGYPKGEVLNLLNYSIDFAPIGMTQKPYRPSEE